jgi:hypothetical protein
MSTTTTSHYPYPPREDCFGYNPAARSRDLRCKALKNLYCAMEGHCVHYAHKDTVKPYYGICRCCGAPLPKGASGKNGCPACRVKTRKRA